MRTSHIQQALKRGILVIFQPHRTEWKNLIGNRDKGNAGICGRDSRLACQRDSDSERDQMKQIVSTNTLLLDVWMIPQISKALNEIVVYFLAWRRFTHDEAISRQIVDVDLLLRCQRMTCWQHRVNALTPELLMNTASPSCISSDESDICIAFANGSHVLRRIALDESQPNAFVLATVCAEKLGQKP